MFLQLIKCIYYEARASEIFWYTDLSMATEMILSFYNLLDWSNSQAKHMYWESQRMLTTGENKFQEQSKDVTKA